MPIDQQAMLTDQGGNLIPQAWDEVADAFVPLTSRGQGLNVRVFDDLPPALSEANVPVPVAPSSLTPPTGAETVLLQVQGGSVRYKTTGTAATPTEGQIAFELSSIYMTAVEATAFSAAVVSGTPNLWAVWS